MDIKPDYESLRNWTAGITDRQGLPYAVYSGLYPPYAEQLIVLSRQPRMLSQTPRDATERFSSRESMERWWQKASKELYFMLESDSEQVCGIIWHAAAPAYYQGKEYPFGFAIRIYDSASGRGLAKPFMTAALRDLVRRRPEAGQGIWLDTGTDNVDAQGLYRSFGYEEVQRDNVRVHMVLSPERIYEICNSGA